MKRKGDTAGQTFMFPVMAELLPCGDGRFILKPHAPDELGEGWISTREAAKILGFTGENANRSVLRLADDGYIESRRPSPMKVKISLKSVLEHKEKTKDPEFWRGRRLRQWRGEA